MKIYTENHNITVPLMEIVHAFTGENAQICDDESIAAVKSKYLGDLTAETSIFFSGKWHSEIYHHTPGLGRNDRQNMSDCLKRGFYHLACKVYGKTLVWGSCTGIRPAKMAEKYLDADREIGFMRDFCVTEKKARLAISVAENQQKLNLGRDDVSVYIGIPFCPSKCRYCSFVSLPMDKQKKVVAPYIEMLIAQIKEVSEIIFSSKKRINTVYIGGGTPSSIDAPLLKLLLEATQKHLLKGSVDEFTLEAGRPDTITDEKLRIMKDGGVSRISINPQSLNDSVLELAGRKHSTEQFYSAFNLARKLEFNNINSDLIAGLEGETTDMFESSLKKLIDLDPEGITLHTLYIKRASQLKAEGGTRSFNADKMVDLAGDMLHNASYIPYYMYRQKDTLDNLENTGFSKKGFECLYNVFMMEDLGTVIGIGGGSVSKVINRKTNRIERVFNLKHPHEYIKNPDATKTRNNQLRFLLENI